MSRPGIAAAGTGGGFTLLEVLVVLLIMGLLVGLVSAMVLPGDRARLGVEGERLARLLALASEEARLGGQAIAWTAEPGGYRFWQHDPARGWTALVGRDLLRPRALPEGMVVVGLRVENTPVTGADRLEFSANGASTAFTLELGLGRARATVVGSPVGEIAVIIPDGVRDVAVRPD